jgi:hypothetical protein
MLSRPTGPTRVQVVDSDAVVSVRRGVPRYDPRYPKDGTCEPSLKDFIRHFFMLTDDPDPGKDAVWAAMFRETATVIIGPHAAVGVSGEFGFPCVVRS